MTDSFDVTAADFTEPLAAWLTPRLGTDAVDVGAVDRPSGGYRRDPARTDLGHPRRR
ncbi:MAG: hypothetical protein R2695_08980 [Acidimicrobiales bacterium]